MRITMFTVVLSVIVIIYGAMHYYLFSKLHAVLPGYGTMLSALLWTFGLSVLAAEFLLQRNIQSMVVYPLVWFTFVWMGYVFVFFFVSVAIDAGAMIAHAIPMQRLAKSLDASQRTLWTLLLTAAIVGYGYWSARQVNVERVNLVSAKLPRALRIVQISDLHLGALISRKYLQDMVTTVNSLSPDIIVSTGDLVDMELDHREDLLKTISRLKARYGKYAVYGNHEVLAGLDASRQFTLAAGFTLLSGTRTTIDDMITIAGVDDPMVKRYTKKQPVNEAELLKHDARGLFTLLLKHQPVINPASPEWFDLQLSGHVHGGQIFPFGLLTRITYRNPTGLSSVGRHAKLYVSRGTGTWGPPMRILAPPEITVFDLQPASGMTTTGTGS